MLPAVDPATDRDDSATSNQVTIPAALSSVTARRRIGSDGVGTGGIVGSMRGVSRYRDCLLACIALGAFACGAPARAADIRLPVKAPYLQPVFDWTGLYIGGHTGYGRGSSTAVLSDPIPAA